jgi:hypothetical protein
MASSNSFLEFNRLIGTLLKPQQAQQIGSSKEHIHIAPKLDKAVMG